MAELVLQDGSTRQAATLCTCPAAQPIRDRIEKEKARKLKAANKRAALGLAARLWRAQRRDAWINAQRKAAAVPPPEPPEIKVRETSTHWSERSSSDGH
jgi:hypothetical protein